MQSNENPVQPLAPGFSIKSCYDLPASGDPQSAPGRRPDVVEWLPRLIYAKNTIN
jgi:hypothetical protein